MPKNFPTPPSYAGNSVAEDTELKDIKSGVIVGSTDLTNDTEYLQQGSIRSTDYEYYDSGGNVFRRFVNTFKRAPSSGSLGDEESFDNIKKADNNLKKTIKSRHVVMISLGTGIGTGLLVGNGKALHNAGPAGLVIGYATMGSCLYCIIQAAGELAVYYTSLVGGFNAYPSLLFDPGFGFAVAWVYCLQWLSVLPLELVTAAITIKYWTTSVNPDIFVAIFYVLIVGINFFGARGYAEAEFFFNTCKILMITGFFILGIIVNCGGAGDSGYIGGKYWHDPGAFSGKNPIDHLKGVASTLITGCFAFGGTELIALTAAEQANPRKSIPSAAKKVLYRILFIFLGSVIIIGFLVPYISDELMGSGGSATHASPYVIAIASHGVKVAPHFINAVILLSVLSVGNSAMYSSPRLILSLAELGYAPSFLKYIDREDRPAIAMAISCVFGLLCFIAASSKEETVFTWLLAISGLSQLFTWSAICLSHIRFRRAMRVQQRSLDEVGFQSQTGVWGSYYAVFVMFLTLICQFWTAIAPIGEGKLDVQSFFENCLAMPMLVVLYFGYKLWERDWRICIPAGEVDLITSRRIFDGDVLRQEDAEYKEKLKNSHWTHRVVNFWC